MSPHEPLLHEAEGLVFVAAVLAVVELAAERAFKLRSAV